MILVFAYKQTEWARSIRLVFICPDSNTATGMPEAEHLVYDRFL